MPPDRPASLRIQSTLFWVVGVAVVATTVIGAFVVRDREDEAVADEVRTAAVDVAAALGDEYRVTLARLDGASAIVTGDGSLDIGVFGRFAAQILGDGEVSAVSLVAVAPDGSSTLAARLGPDGSPADVADGIDPAVRAALSRATADSGSVVARSVDPAGDGDRAVALAHPVERADGGPPIGFVVAHVPDARSQQVLESTTEDGFAVLVSDGDATWLGEPFERREHVASAELPVADRILTVTTGPRPSPDRTAMWLVVGTGALAMAVVLGLALSTRRHQRRLRSENERLVREGERSKAAQIVTAQLAHAISVDEVVVALRDLLPAAVGARTASLATRVGDGSFRVAGDDDGQDAAVVADNGVSLAEESVESGRPVWLSSPLDWRGDVVVQRLAQDGNAVALLPLVSGEIRGVLAVSYERIHVFDDNEREVLATVGVLAGQALDRGRRYDTEHDAAVAFQEAALPAALPTVPGLAIAARYRPAARDAAVGGDWYDVLALDARRTMLVVGDVVGHGMEAAAAMARIRTALQVIVSLDSDPGVILRTMSSQIDAIPNAFCTTVLCVVVDREARTITWSRAGHPPPLLVSAAGATLLDDPGAPPLGVASDVSSPVHTRRIQLGDRLVLFTDGMVERRGESIGDGFDRLALVCESLTDLDAAEFADVVVEALMPHDEQTDDIAILVVGFDPVAVPAVVDEACLVSERSSTAP